MSALLFVCSWASASQTSAAGAPTAQANPDVASAATQAVVASAQAQGKARQFAEAVAALTLANKPELPAADKRALNFALADAQGAWGGSLVQTSHYRDALPHLEAAELIDKSDLSRRNRLGIDLGRTGIVYIGLSQYEKAIGYGEQALSIFKELKNRNAEAVTLNSIGSAYIRLSQYEKAIVYYQQVLKIDRDIKDRDGEGAVLGNLGNAYFCLSEYAKSIACDEQALPILRDVKNLKFESNVLSGLGAAHCRLNHYKQAIDYYQQAIPIYGQIDDRFDEAIALNGLGSVFTVLGQNEKAIDCYQQALSIHREDGNRDGEGMALFNIGGAFQREGQYKTAIDYIEKSVPLLREVKDRDAEANARMNLGVVYTYLGQFEKASDSCKQALPIFREVKDRQGESMALVHLGTAYEGLHQYDEAVDRIDQALPICREVKDRDDEAMALDILSDLWARPDNPRRQPALAVFFGKQAVNVCQSIRADLKELDKNTQRQFTRSVAKIYRYLAILLISQGRLTEGLQVLDLLKEEEYLNFSRPESGPDAGGLKDLLAQRTQVTPREQRIGDRLDAIGERLAAEDEMQAALSRQEVLTPEQRALVSTLSRRLVADAAAYEGTLNALPVEFAHPTDPVLDHMATTTNAHNLQAALQKLGSGKVVLYTLVDNDKVHVLLVTPTRIIARESHQTRAGELSQEIQAFRVLLQRPDLDPRPLGKRLYELLIGPIQKDLNAAHAQTLLVSLDGNLRYIPLAALSPDGKHYLIETYQTALYTPAALANLLRQPKRNWTALAMGVAAPPDGFAPLYAVPQELKAVVRTADESGADAGAFPGVRLLDGAFTKEAMVTELGRGYPLVHIASHFVFSGDENTSFLLLGDGAHLSLADLKALPDDVFSGVNLLTLSACETATGTMEEDSASSGRDVENVAVLAQRKGADAVLASLWAVNDDSTDLLMRTFYRARTTGGTAPSKAEALRRAQLALLMGQNAAAAPVAASRAATLEAPPAAGTAATGTSAALVAAAPPFPHNEPTFAHPCYWASFILIGNIK